MERLSICENDSFLPISMQNVSYYFSRNLLKFKGFITVKEIVEIPIEHSYFLWKCLSINDRCEIFTNSSTPEICDMLEGKEEKPILAFEKFFSMIKPKVTCPIQPGSYDLSDSVINLDFISHLPIEGNLWHLEVFLLRRKEEEEDQMIACLDSYIRVFLGSSRGNRG